MDKKAQQLQLDLIKTLLAMHRASVHENKLIAPSSTVLHYSENITDEQLLQEAWRIYQEMISRSIKGDDGDFTWITQRFSLHTNKIYK